MKRKANPLIWWKLMEESLPRLLVIAKRIICVNASSTSSESAFSSWVLSLLSSRERPSDSNKSTWCDLVSQAEYGSSSAVNMDHPCLAVQQGVIGNGQMSWKLSLHRPTSQFCQTLPVPGTRLLSFDPPPLSLSLSLSLSLLALNDCHINKFERWLMSTSDRDKSWMVS